jgi:predicted N-acyltransferase
VGVPFTPVTGSRLLVAPGEDRALWEPRLAQALKDICLRGACSGVHVNFCRESQLTALGETDYLIRMGFQYHWENAGYECFEDYLARFRSKRRNQIRREQREMESQGVVIETSAGEAIDDALFEPMYRFYLATIRTHYYGRRYLNRAFFELLGERFRRNLVLVVARQGDELIGGALNIAKGDTLYGRYWGALRPLRHLHFNVCYYAAVNYCIENRLSRFEPGAGGEYKQVRGFDAQPTWSGHFLVDPRLGEAVAKYLQSERQEAQRAIDWIRSESALKPAR